MAALGALLPQRFPAWDVVDLERYVAAESVLTKIVMLDTTVRMVKDLKLTAERKLTLRLAARLLALAVVATSVGTIFD